MKVLAFLAGLAQAQMTITSYSGSGVSVEFVEIEGASSYTAVQSVNGVETSAPASGTTHSFSAGSDSDIFDYIQIRGMAGTDMVSQYHMHDVATGGMSATVSAMYDLGNDGEGANNGTMVEMFVKPDRTSGDCYNEMTVTFACDLMSAPTVHGVNNATGSSYDSVDRKLTVGFGGDFKGSSVKVSATFMQTEQCYIDLGLNVNTTVAEMNDGTVTIASTGASADTLLSADMDFELVLDEPADSRVENYPDESQDPLPAPHAGKSGMGQPIEGVDNGPVVMYPLNATMVLFRMEIPANTDKKSCDPKIEITMNCVFNEVKLFGFKATEMDSANGMTLETELENSSVSEAAMMIVYGDAAVGGTCFGGDDYKPTVKMTYNRFL